MLTEQIFERASEHARLAIYWRRQAEALRAGGEVAGVDRRKALALARRSEAAVFDLAITAESRPWGTESSERRA